MDGETEVEQLVATMCPLLRSERFVFVTLPPGGRPPAGVEVVASVVEPEGLSVVVTSADADGHGLTAQFACAWIVLRVHSSLAAVGFLAVVTAALAQAGISVNAVAGVHHDHLFVPWERRHDAMATLRTLSATR